MSFDSVLDAQDLLPSQDDGIQLNIAEIPSALQSDHSPSQSSVLSYALPDNRNLLQEAIDRFESSSPFKKSLDDIRDIYERERTSAAIQMLTHRYKIDWRSSPSVTNLDETDAVAWCLQDHYLDMLVLVSDGLGLGAALPNILDDPSWELTLRLALNPLKSFTIRSVKLGFDPAGRFIED
jgi:hypothetical protein